MAEYTAGNDRLHMCYSFEMLSPDFTAAHFRKTIEGVRKGAPDGHSCWSFSNHDVVRHVTRWAGHATDPDALARQSAAMLLSFPGAISLYQGEELGQTETDLVYAELTDPPALRFWPEVRGRDGCRTPMVWDRTQANAGFSTGIPWLPVKEPQAARAVAGQQADNDSVLAAYRAIIAFRKATPALRWGRTEFLELAEPILAFRRDHEGQAVTCVFNLSARPVRLKTDATALTGPSSAMLGEGILSLPANGFAWIEGAPGLSR